MSKRFQSLLLSTAAVAVTAALGLTACAGQADPVVARDSLVTVTEDPSLPTAAEEFSAELHPDPVVEAIDCSPILVITVRGTGEPSKGQLLSPVARTIKKADSANTEVIDLDYPADTEVKEGGTAGVRTLVDTLNVQTEACDEQRFVLLGYSQGALVIGEALSAPASRLIGGTVGEVSETAADQIAAIVLYGDPRFLGAEDFNSGDYDPDMGGLLPRVEGALKAYDERIIDFCVGTDFVCQAELVLATNGELDETGHVAYYDNGMQKLGSAFVLDIVKPDPKEKSSDLPKEPAKRDQTESENTEGAR